MLIKDIPFKAVREMALEEQFRQNGFRDENIRLDYAFFWDTTKLGGDFWYYIYRKQFDKAREIWDWGKEGESGN